MISVRVKASDCKKYQIVVWGQMQNIDWHCIYCRRKLNMGSLQPESNATSYVLRWGNGIQRHTSYNGQSSRDIASKTSLSFTSARLVGIDSWSRSRRYNQKSLWEQKKGENSTRIYWEMMFIWFICEFLKPGSWFTVNLIAGLNDLEEPGPTYILLAEWHSGCCSLWPPGFGVW